MKLTRYITLILIAVTVFVSRGQELNCKVEINTSQISGTNKSVFTTLQEAVNEYMNNTAFTSAQFAANEKIDCQLYFTIKEYDGNIMKGDLQIQSTRPVYNSAYTTTVLNFKDSKIDFEYQEDTPLIYSQNSMESQLTAILDYYALLIIALDFDTFSPHGGDPMYERLRQIVQWAQSSGETGWKAFEDTNNRSAVLSALTDSKTSGIRDLLYNYHRKGLDEMSVAPDKGRQVIHNTLKDIETIYKNAPMSVVLTMFKDSKLDELVNVYSQGSDEERRTAYDLLSPIYPAEMQRLEKIKKGKEKR